MSFLHFISCFTRTWKEETSHKQKGDPPQLPGNAAQEAVEIPTFAEYALDGSKKAIQLLQIAAGLIPIPYVQDLIGVALTVIQTCEDVSAIEGRVKNLQNRVENVIVILLDRITEGEQNSDQMRTEAEGLKGEIIVLHSRLETISQSLRDIKSQNRWILMILRNPNKAKVDDCMDQLQTAVERFQISHDIRSEEVLQRLESRLSQLQEMTRGIAETVAKVESKVDTLRNILETGPLAHNSSLGVHVRPMPLKPAVFHGRSSVVQELATALTVSETSRVCILGPGGMGKTTVALAIMETKIVQNHFQPRNRFWIPCIEATSPSLFIRVLYSHLRITRSTKDALEDVLSELQASRDPRLLLLDNMETALSPLQGSQSETVDILRRLAALPHVALLLTMRGIYPPVIGIPWKFQNLSPTDRNSSRQIYIDINPLGRQDPDLDKLLDTLGHMPFAVTLMANLAMESHAHAHSLLRDWENVGIGMLSGSDDKERSMSRCIALSVESKLVREDPCALPLLAALSLLPAGTSRDHLESWTPFLNSWNKPLATLGKAGLITVTGDNDSISVPPVIQSYMRSERRIPPEILRQVKQACYRFVNLHPCNIDDRQFRTDLMELESEETNIQTLPMEGSSPPHINISESQASARPTSVISKIDVQDYLHALLIFARYQGHTKPRTEIAGLLLKLAQDTNDDVYTAHALLCLGYLHKELTHFSKACEYLEEARDCFQKLSDPLKGLECTIEMAEASIYVIPSAYILELWNNLDEILEGSCADYLKARVKLIIGNDCFTRGRPDAAIPAFKDALETFEPLQLFSTMSLCYDRLARAYLALGKLDAAIQSSLKGLEAAKLAKNQYMVGECLQSYSMELIFSGDYDLSLENLQRSLQAARTAGFVLGEAQALELLGYLYVEQGEYEAAWVAYNAALPRYQSLVNVSPDYSDTPVTICAHTISEPEVAHVSSSGTPP